MGKTLRSIGAVLAGFVAATIVMTLVESLNGHVLYPDLGKQAQGLTDRSAVRAVMASAPVGALLVVVAGWTLGSLVGGFLAARIGRTAPVGHAIVLAGVLTLAGIANNLMIPPPLWFWVVSIAVFAPAAYAGARLVDKADQAPG